LLLLLLAAARASDDAMARGDVGAESVRGDVAFRCRLLMSKCYGCEKIYLLPFSVVADCDVVAIRLASEQSATRLQ
jgi:hypothetical protein